MVNDKGRRVKAAPPSTPVEILGLVRSSFGRRHIQWLLHDEKLARDVADAEKAAKCKKHKFNSTLLKYRSIICSRQIDEGNMKELDVIIKADVQGSRRSGKTVA